MAKMFNLDVLKSLPSQTQAFLVSRMPLLLTPVELNLLGLRRAPIAERSLLVQLKCSARSLLNDKRLSFGYEPLEPEQTLPWGKWEIEDAVVVNEEAGTEVRYLRYYDSMSEKEFRPKYFDAETGEPFSKWQCDEISRMIRRRNKRFSHPVHLLKFDFIVSLYTLTSDGQRDADIITSDQLD